MTKTNFIPPMRQHHNTTVHDFCQNCVKAEDTHWLTSEISVVNQVQRTCHFHLDGMQTTAAACRLYVEADQKMSPRWLKRLYKQIAQFLTQSGIPAEYYPDEEHKVQSGYKSLAIVEGVCVFFQYRKPVASVRMTYPELWACIIRRMMLS